MSQRFIAQIDGQQIEVSFQSNGGGDLHSVTIEYKQQTAEQPTSLVNRFASPEVSFYIPVDAWEYGSITIQEQLDLTAKIWQAKQVFRSLQDAIIQQNQPPTAAQPDSDRNKLKPLIRLHPRPTEF